MKRGTPRHPKIAHLCELLRVKLPTAVGYLELLWHFTAEFAPQGDIGRFADQRIEAAISWPGSPGNLASALVEAGWLDRNEEHRLVVHDWHDHADDAVRKRLSRAKLPFLSYPCDTAKVTGEPPTPADNGSLPEPEPSRSHRQTPAPDMHIPIDCVEKQSDFIKHQKPVRVRRTPVAADLDEPPPATSGRFDEWWTRWCELTGRAQNKAQACQAWLSVVKPGDEEAVAGCLERYGLSDEVGRTVITNPDRWLFAQAQNHWQGDWPRKRPATHASKQQENADAWGNA